MQTKESHATYAEIQDNMANIKKTYAKIDKFEQWFTIPYLTIGGGLITLLCLMMIDLIFHSKIILFISALIVGIMCAALLVMIIAGGVWFAVDDIEKIKRKR